MNNKLEVSDANKSRESHLPSIRLALYFGLVLILYFPVLVSLVHDWLNDPDFSHGFLVAPISLYLVWQKREKLKAPPLPSNWGLLFLASGLLFFLLGKIAEQPFLQQFSFLMVIAGIILFVPGKAHLKTIAFPVAFLIFMIPIPTIVIQKITFPMRLFASRYASHILDYLAVPAIRKGNVIHLPNTALNVAEACSGIRSIISLLTIGTLIAYFNNKTLWQRLLVILTTVPVAIAVNVFRISLTAFLVFNFGPEAARGLFHELIGAALFLRAAAFFYLFSSILSRLVQVYKGKFEKRG